MITTIRNFIKHYPRSGKTFKKCMAQMRDRNNFTREQLREYQTELLKVTIQIAYDGVPYYKKVFKKLGLTPQDIQTIEDLQKLPIIDKYTVRENFKEFRNKKFKGIVASGSSSGTSGTPTKVLRDLYSINYNKAIFWRQYEWAGKTLNSRRVTLRGEIICPIDQQNPPFWRYNKFTNELLLSARHMSDKNMKYYIKEILDFKGYDLYAYPAAASWLAEYCLRTNAGVTFSAVFTDAEVLSAKNRKTIEKAFSCKVYDQYGSAERVVNLAQCEAGNYHELSDYSIVEYIPQGDNLHKVVGTTIFNSVMPLIRYNMGDLVELNKKDTCSCGRNNFRTIKKIVGRQDDIILLQDGRKIKSVTDIFYNMDFLKEAQIIQYSLNKFKIVFVPSRKTTQKDHTKLQKEAYSFIGKNIECTITETDSIKRNKSGKYRTVVNLMERKDLKWN